jgi:hypothetical protein
METLLEIHIGEGCEWIDIVLEIILRELYTEVFARIRGSRDQFLLEIYPRAILSNFQLEDLNVFTQSICTEDKYQAAECKRVSVIFGIASDWSKDQTG